MTDLKNTLVPFNQLEQDEENRREHYLLDGLDELAQSIVELGIIVPLIVRVGRKNKFAVVDGRRRLLAIEKLVNDGRLKADTPVPVIVREDLNLKDADAATVSVAANVVREAMNPADEVRAFRHLRDRKKTPEQIAAAFGIGLKRVKQRLALADLSPKVLDTLAKGEIDLDLAAAFAASNDHNAQNSALKQIGQYSFNRDPATVRAILRKEAIKGTSDLARFVGRKAYEAAGGKVRTDLFDNVVIFENAELLLKLARDIANETKAKLKKEGWAWVEFASDLPKGADRHYHRIFPATDNKYTPEQKKRLAELRKLDNSNDGLSDDESDEFEAIEEDARIRSYSKADKAKSGVIIDLDNFGITYGVQKPKEQKAEAKKAGKAMAGNSKNAIPNTLLDDLAAILCGGTQMTVAQDPDLAEAVLIAQLSPAVRQTMWTTMRGPLAISGAIFSNDDKDNLGHQAFKKALNEVIKDAPKTFSECVAWALKRKPAQRRVIISHLLAAYIKPSRGLTHGQNMSYETTDATTLAKIAKPDMLKWWSPSTDLLSRYNKGQLIGFMKEVEPKKPASTWTGLKRTALAKAVADAAPKAKWLPKEFRV
jgi:ParB family chromosome partitioning protein